MIKRPACHIYVPEVKNNGLVPTDAKFQREHKAPHTGENAQVNTKVYNLRLLVAKSDL